MQLWFKNNATEESKHHIHNLITSKSRVIIDKFHTKAKQSTNFPRYVNKYIKSVEISTSGN